MTRRCKLTLTGSHLHWDHIGDPTKWPGTTKLIFGPDIRKTHGTGWPANPKAPFAEKDLAGRQFVALEAKDFKLEIGGLRAPDFFGDGSFYLLDAPGVRPVSAHGFLGMNVADSRPI
jgi:hypothetical protein